MNNININIKGEKLALPLKWQSVNTCLPAGQALGQHFHLAFHGHDTPHLSDKFVTTDGIELHITPILKTALNYSTAGSDTGYTENALTKLGVGFISFFAVSNTIEYDPHDLSGSDKIKYSFEETDNLGSKTDKKHFDVDNDFEVILEFSKMWFQRHYLGTALTRLPPGGTQELALVPVLPNSKSLLSILKSRPLEFLLEELEETEMGVAGYQKKCAEYRQSFPIKSILNLDLASLLRQFEAECATGEKLIIQKVNAEHSAPK